MTVAFAAGEQIKLRLFLAGIEVDVISATISASEGAPAVAQIELVPLESVTRLHPRTIVHLFWLDYMEYQLDPTSAQDTHYKLLFCGELSVVTWGKSGAGSLSASIQCIDFSCHWDAAFLYQARFANNPNALAGDTRAFLTATEGTPVSDIPSEQLDSVIASMAAGAAGRAWSPALSNIDSVMGGVLSILELVGGVPDVSSGLNGWFTVRERMVRLLDQIGSDTGATAAGLFQATEFTAFIKTQLGNYGDVMSFRDILNLILGYVYYGIVPNPVASYRPGTRAPLKERPAETPPTFVYAAPIEMFLPETGSVVDYIHARCKGGAKLANLQIIERVFTEKGIPREVIAAAMVNSWFESGFEAGVQSHIKSTHAPTADTRSGKDEFQGVYGPNDWENSFGLFQIYALGPPGKNYQPRSNNKGMTVAERKNPETNARAILIDPKVPEVLAAYQAGDRNIASLAGLWCTLVERPANAVAEGYKRALGATQVFNLPVNQVGAPTPPTTGTLPPASQPATIQVASTATSRERMITQILRPDIWFASPPTCNVIFPEECSSFSFTQQKLAEVTRVQLATYDSLIDTANPYSVLQSAYFAPVFAAGSGLQQLTPGGIGSAAKPLIYAHERHSGVVPRIERMSDLAFLAVQRGEGATVEDYGAAAAAFNFLRYRYASRSAQISCRFLPRIIPGLPAVLLSNPTIPGVAEKEATHVVGMVTQVTHSLSQGGAVTSVSLAYARPHTPDASDQFIKKLKVLKNREEASTVVAPGTGLSILDEKLADWLWGRLNALGDRAELTEAECATAPPGRNGLKIIRVTGIQVGDTPAAPGPTSSNAEGEGADPAVSSTPADATKVYPFSSATFVEEFSGQTLPLEDAIRPPWISEDYANENIGNRYYDPLFGCRAIVDRVSLVDLQAVDPTITKASVEDAVSLLATEYASVSGGGSRLAGPWIWELTRRAYASLPEVLGESGFHNYATGDFSALENLGLDTPLSPKRAIALQGALASGKVSPELDIRQEQRDAVRAYWGLLEGNRGLRG